MKKSLKLLLASADQEHEDAHEMSIEGPDPRNNVVYLPQAYQAHWAEEDLAERERVTSRGRFAEFACSARQRFRVATLGQAGMATAEYAIATLATVDEQRRT